MIAPMPVFAFQHARLLAWGVLTTLAAGSVVSAAPVLATLLVSPAVTASTPAATPFAEAAPAAPAAKVPLRVVVSIAPFAEFARRLAPEGSTITQLIPTGVSEHGYEIPPGKLRELADAQLVILAGAGLEPQAEKVLSTRWTAQQRAKGLVVMQDVLAGESGKPEAKTKTKTEPEPEHQHSHAHGDECDHTGDNDPHFWLDPLAMRQVAIAIGQRITGLLTADVTEAAAKAELTRQVAARTAAVVREIDQLDAEYRQRLSAKAHRTIIVTHDAWGHLSRRYELTTVALKGVAAGEPTLANIKLASETVRKHAIGTIFTEPQLSSAAAKRVADATGSRLATLDPLGNGDWFSMMRANLEAIAASLPDGPAKSGPDATPDRASAPKVK